MNSMQKVARWGGMRAARRMSRTVPLVGGLVAVGALAATMRRKGMLRGALDTVLTALPWRTPLPASKPPGGQACPASALATVRPPEPPSGSGPSPSYPPMLSICY